VVGSVGSSTDTVQPRASPTSSRILKSSGSMSCFGRVHYQCLEYATKLDQANLAGSVRSSAPGGIGEGEGQGDLHVVEADA